MTTPYAQKRLQVIFSALAPDIMKYGNFATSKDAEKGARVLNWDSRNGMHDLHAHINSRPHEYAASVRDVHEPPIPTHALEQRGAPVYLQTQ